MPAISLEDIPGGFFWALFPTRSASPKPHPSKPHPCNMPQAKMEVALQFSKCCAAEVALQHWLFCSAEVILTKSCTAASEKLHCNIEKAALQESGAFLPLSCGFQAPTFRHPRLGPADKNEEKKSGDEIRPAKPDPNNYLHLREPFLSWSLQWETGK